LMLCARCSNVHEMGIHWYAAKVYRREIAGRY
jgi:hypothetical protein